MTTAEHDLTLDDVEVNTGESLLHAGAVARFCRLVNECVGTEVLDPAELDLSAVVEIFNKAQGRGLADITSVGVMVNVLQYDWRQAAEETGRTPREVHAVLREFADMVARESLYLPQLHLVDGASKMEAVDSDEAMSEVEPCDIGNIATRVVVRKPVESSDLEFDDLPTGRSLSVDTLFVFDDSLRIDPSDIEAGGDPNDLALCAQTDPELFFPEKGGSTRESKAVCAKCEIENLCLERALAVEERFGVLGGKSERERRAIAKKRKKATEAGSADGGLTGQEEESKYSVHDRLIVLASMVNVDGRNYDDAIEIFRSNTELHEQFVGMLLDRYDVHKRGKLRPQVKEVLLHRLMHDGPSTQGVPQALGGLKRYVESLSERGVGIVDEVLDVIYGYESGPKLSEMEEAV